MKQKTALLVLLITMFTNLGAQPTINWDSLDREARKTEVYSPIPPVVMPGKTTQDAPSDALILFNGKNLDAWTADDTTKSITWKVSNGMFAVDNSKGHGGISTKRKFLDYQLHIEWLEPLGISGEGETRGNSGIFLAAYSIFPIRWMPGVFMEHGYEIQILENFNNNNKVYVNGQAGAVYKQQAPLVNACRKPGEWQTYDIFWKAPRFNSDSSLKTPGFVTLVQNGILVQLNTEVKGETNWIGEPKYTSHGPSPIRLQAHGDPGPSVSFRNIWIRPI